MSDQDLPEEVQEGMRLRGRQLPGVVPVVQRRPPGPQPMSPEDGLASPRERSAPSERLSLFGTIKKKLIDVFSALTVGSTTSYESVAMEETFIPAFSSPPVTSTPMNANNAPPPKDQLGRETDDSTQALRKPPQHIFPHNLETPRQHRRGLVQQNHAPLEDTASQPVVNNYTNCSFGSGASEGSSRRAKIPVFDDTKIDIEAYLANFSAITGGWDEQEKLKALREKLEGRAAKVLANLDLQGQDVTYPMLVEELEQHYVGERSLWMTKLRDTRREEGESLDDLAFRLSLYSKRAYGTIRDDLGLELYLALRDTPLGDKLYAFKDRPLAEILQQAKSYESHLLSTNQAVTSQSALARAVASLSSPSQQPHGNGRDDQNRSLNDRGRSGGRGRGRGRGRYNNQDRRYNRQERRCNVCNSPEHLWRECPYVHRHFQAQGATAAEVNTPCDPQPLNP